MPFKLKLKVTTSITPWLLPFPQCSDVLKQRLAKLTSRAENGALDWSRVAAVRSEREGDDAEIIRIKHAPSLRRTAETAPAQAVSWPRYQGLFPAEIWTTAASRSGRAAPPSWPRRTWAGGRTSSRRGSPTGKGARRKDRKKGKEKVRCGEKKKNNRKEPKVGRWGGHRGVEGEQPNKTNEPAPICGGGVCVCVCVCVCVFGGLQQLCNLPI